MKPSISVEPMTSRIFKVTGWLDFKGFDKRIIEIEVTEKDKSFVSTGKRIGKNKLIQLSESAFRQTNYQLSYFTYCVDGDQQKALDMIKARILFHSANR